MSDKPRYMIDHGTIHDLASGTHMRTSPEADGDPGDEQIACCAALNAYDAEIASLRAEVDRLRGDVTLYREHGESGWARAEALAQEVVVLKEQLRAALSPQKVGWVMGPCNICGKHIAWAGPNTVAQCDHAGNRADAIEWERARIVAAIRKDVRSRNTRLVEAIKAGHLNAAHGEGECRQRIADELSRWADKIERGCPDGE